MSCDGCSTPATAVRVPKPLQRCVAIAIPCISTHSNLPAFLARRLLYETPVTPAPHHPTTEVHVFQVKANRWVAAALLATTSLLTFAPIAEAGHGRGRGKGRRYKDERVVYRQESCAPAPQRVIVRESGGSGPILAGVIGGFILGSAVSQRSDRNYRRAPAPSYRYYDEACDESYSSLDQCRSHFRSHNCGPRVIKVIEVSSGECVRTVRYDGGNWRDYDDDDQYYDN